MAISRKIAFWSVACVAALVVVALASALVSWSTNAGLEPPPGVRCFRNSVEVHLKPSESGREAWKAGYHAAVLTKNRLDEIHVPLIQVMRSRRSGLLGRLRNDRVWTTSFEFVGESQSVIEFPVEEDISHYYVLIRQLEGNPGPKVAGPWHLWVVPRVQITDAPQSTLMLPDLGVLTPLAEEKNGEIYLATVESAEQYLLSLSEKR
jgi:hypothetical protein